MRSKTKTAFWLFLMVSLIPLKARILAAQQAPLLTPEDQEQIIANIRTLLEKYYLFPETGREIGAYLQRNFNEDKYEKLSDPRRFARRITVDLQQTNKDKHLSLVYDPQRVKELRAGESRPSDEELKEIAQKRIEKRRRENFGFRKLELLEGNVGYLDLRSFTSTDDASSTALGAMKFLSNNDAIIIDLRENPGGEASMYLLLISYFFDSDMVHLSDLVDRRSNTEQQFWTLPYVPGQRLPDVDLYLLTSERTFSAAEEFAYDLQSLKRAVVVGEKTGGGAHLTTRMVVDDNFYLFVPFAGSRNPVTRTNWEGVGVRPDIEVPEAEAFETAYRLALEALIKKTPDEEWKKHLSSLLAGQEAKRSKSLEDW